MHLPFAHKINVCSSEVIWTLTLYTFLRGLDRYSHLFTIQKCIYPKAFALCSLLFHWKVLIELYKKKNWNGVNLKINDSSVSPVVQKRVAIRMIILFKIH